MKKEIIIRCIQGEASPSERDSLERWISLSKVNRDYYYRLYNDVALMTAFAGDNECDSAEDEYNLFVEKHNITQKRGKSIFYRVCLYSAGVAAAIALFFVLFRQEYEGDTYTETVAYDMMSYSVVFNGSSETLFYRLPDSSIVFLNKGATIYISDGFGKTDRDVYLNGESFFDVAKNPNLPMHIKTDNNIKVTITGTSFFINSNAESKSFELSLTRGSVNVDIPTFSITGNNVQMIEGESIAIDSMMQYTTAPIQDSFYQANNFVDNWFNFRDKKMKYVLGKISDYYMVDFIISDKEINSFSFTGDLSNLSLSNILDIFSKSMNIHHKKNNKGQICLSF